MSRRSRVAAVLAAVLAAACTPPQPPVPSPPPEPPWTYPGAEWRRLAPAAAGFDRAALDALAATAGAAGSSCTVVTRYGNLVDERYWGGAGPTTVRQAWSVTKSLTSLLVGIAQDEGDLRTGDRASLTIPQWRGTASATVTIEDLLSGDSGRHWDPATDYQQMAVAARDKTAFSIGLGQDAPPGQVWAYNNAAVQSLAAVLRAATGEDPASFAQTRVLDAIGMRHSSMGRDASGGAMLFAGLRSTCRDLARLGYLALRDGQWAGRRVVSPAFVRRATRQRSQDLNHAYGWAWWGNRPGPMTSPLIATTGHGAPGTLQGPLLPGAPNDVFWALGFQGQIVAVVPSEGIVAVRMGAAPPAAHPLDQTTFTRAVLAALRP